MWVSPHLLKFTIYFVRSGCQLSRFFDLRPLSYLQHWQGVCDGEVSAKQQLTVHVYLKSLEF